MHDFSIKEKNVLKVLEDMAKHFDAEFNKEFSCSLLHLNNQKGKGFVTAYELFPGLAAIIYSLTFSEDVILTVNEEDMNPLYFIFCLKGSLKHKFSSENQYKSIHSQQNVIITSSVTDNNIFYFPANQKIECSFIYLFRESDPISGDKEKLKYLRKGMSEILTQIGDINGYKYFGQIRPDTGHYLDRVIHNDKKGVIARLFIEASILNILALQLEHHKEQKDSPNPYKPPLRKDEIKRLLEVCNYISNNLDKPLNLQGISEMSNLNPKKVQTGFRYLFGTSANNYLRNVRLEAALEMLQTSELSISEIVYKIGLSSRSYFSKIFMERYGYLPSVYQKEIESHNKLLHNETSPDLPVVR